MIFTPKLKLPRPEESDNHNLVNQQALIDAIEKNAMSGSDLDSLEKDLNTHANKKDNPHATTAAQVGAYSKTEADGRFETPTGAKSKIDAAIAALIDGAPGAIDTLNELAAALGDDPNFATTVANALATKETPAGAQAKVNTHANLKNNPHGVTAAQTPITDAGNYYAGTNTEAALQEIGQALNGSRGSIIAATNQLLLL